MVAPSAAERVAGEGGEPEWARAHPVAVTVLREVFGELLRDGVAEQRIAEPMAGADVTCPTGPAPGERCT